MHIYEKIPANLPSYEIRSTFIRTDVCWRTFKLFTTISTDPLYVALIRKQLVTDTETPLEYVSEWEVVPPDGSAHILVKYQHRSNKLTTV